MRELNAGSHKLRRPSFSNTLSELPEVEEPQSANESPCPSLDLLTSYDILPPISNEEILQPSPRPRLHTLPYTTFQVRASPAPPPSLPFRHPRLNTLPYTPYQRPPVVRIQTHDQEGDWKSLNVGDSPKHGEDGKLAVVKKLQTHLTDPFKTRANKRRGSIDKPARRFSLSSEHPYKSCFRTDDTKVPTPIRSSSGSVSPSLVNDSRLSRDSSTEPVDKLDTMAVQLDLQGREKEEDIIRWRNGVGEDEGGDGRSPSCEGLDRLKSLALGVGGPHGRRSSLPADPTWSRRWSNPEFARTNQRVDLLMEYGRIWRRRQQGLPADDKTTRAKKIRTLADFVMDIPKKPRFSSFMSPEAQYSLMKGYEDTLYRRLSQSIPEHSYLLKRNKTPRATVEIKPKNTLGFLDNSDDDEEEDSDEDGDHCTDTEPDNAMSSFLTQTSDETSCYSLARKSRSGRPSCSSVKTESTTAADSPSSSKADSKSVLRSLRRLSISLGKGGDVKKAFHEEADEEEADICSLFTPVQRSCSLPNVGSVTLDRRLMMAYRLQSAMDILDNIRPQDEAKLSPRIKPRHGAGLADYNAWVAEWNREFTIRNRQD